MPMSADILVFAEKSERDGIRAVVLH